MAHEILYTGQLTETDFLALLKACHTANMFAEALVLAEQFPRQVIKKKERQDLLFFQDVASHLPWNAGETPAWHTYLSGRIFTEQWELRWVRQQQEVRVIYLGPPIYDGILRDYKLNDRVDDKSESPPVPDTLTKQVRPYYLFGERLRPDDVKNIIWAEPGDFAEARIPRLLRYPAANCRGQNADEVAKMPYVQLRICEYIDETGRVVLSRFQCLQATEGK
jgi:hypothetical protein